MSNQLEVKCVKLFEFLRKNNQRKYRTDERLFLDFHPIEGEVERNVLTLLYLVLSTQSQLNIDNGAEFFIELNKDKTALNTLNVFNFDQIKKRATKTHIAYGA